jgi:5-methylcytosine-specific restriction protein A
VPTRAPQACPRCKRPTTNRGRCGDCDRKYQQRRDAKRGTAAERGYDSKWAKASRAFLAKHPTCVYCGKLGADAVDHDPPHGGDKAAFWDRNRWKSAHRRCHDRKTVAQDIARDERGQWTGPTIA